MGVKIYYASDIHSEFMRYPQVPQFGADADIIVLAGDIGVGTQAMSYVGEVAAEYPDARIVWVAGNHEFYGGDIDTRLEEFRRFAREHAQIHFLENESCDIQGLSFLGCTLWTDFSILGPQAAEECQREGWRRLADGRHIRHRGRALESEDVIQRFRESYRWLSAELSRRDPRRTVVVTHFPPCREARHQRIAEDYFSAYFQANAQKLLEEHPVPFWIYGHNHWSDQKQVAHTRLVSNQLGYLNERDSLVRFKDSAHIEMDVIPRRH